MVRRKRPGEFSKQTIDLLQTFAAQSVLAIQNARLFHEIEDKSRQLAVASQHKSQFLANMSHELRTPLNAILGYTELILDGIYGETPAKMRGVLERVQRNGKHLLGLINDVLDLSKIEAGQLTLSLVGLLAQEVVIQTVFSAIEPLASEKQIALKIDVAQELPQGRGDERRLTQVLLNLVGNAIKFTDIGEVSIKGSSANGSFNVAVRDTGPGISTADQAKLFQEFQQADNSITKKKGGTGLGLAISRRIIEMHGGRIWVESSPAMARPSHSHFPSPSKSRRSRHEQANFGGRGPGGQSADRARFAEPTDYEMTEAENGEEALAAAAKHRPDLILMDIQLPIMDGYEATRRIKADPSLSSIPIIAVTSYALSGDEEKARAAGCNAYVAKPYSPRALLAKIREYLP